jgi:hypothetical protein
MPMELEYEFETAMPELLANGLLAREEAQL